MRHLEAVIAATSGWGLGRAIERLHIAETNSSALTRRFDREFGTHQRTFDIIFHGRHSRRAWNRHLVVTSRRRFAVPWPRADAKGTGCPKGLHGAGGAVSD